MSYNMTSNYISNPIPNLIEQYLPKSIHPFFILSYPIYSNYSTSSSLKWSNYRSIPKHGTILYEKGLKDIYFVISSAIILTLLRHLTMNFVFAPFAGFMLKRNKRLELKRSSPRQIGNGKSSNTKMIQRESKKDIKKTHHIITRFSEQAWSWLYCTVFWTFGMCVLFSEPSPLSPEQLWGTYPYIPLPASMKFYYLSQLGWWLHQIYVINTEKRRKDHWQMFGHHILTITLIISSYKANFTRIGVVIHCLMDFCDIFLPLAKMLRYLSYTQACDITFVIFLVSWLFSREIGLYLVIKSSYSEAPKHIPFLWSPSTGAYLTFTIYSSFLCLISLLWILASIWFYMACMVAIRVVKGQGAEDSRSDDEEDQDEDTSSIDLDDGIREKELLDDVPQSVGSAASTIDSTTNGISILGNGHNCGELKKRK